MLRSRGRPDKTYVDSLRADTGLNETGEMGRLMDSRCGPATELFMGIIRLLERSSSVFTFLNSTCPDLII